MNATTGAPSVFDVCVIGAGVAGMAMALGAAQLGLRTALVGPAPRIHAATDAAPFDPRIYALAPSAVDLLTRLKVWGAMNPQRVQAVARMRVFGDSGNELTFDAYQAALERLATIVEESELLRTLATACGYACGLSRFTGSLDRLQFGAAAADVTLDDGSTIGARLVIGADGARSAVRAAAGINADTRSYEQTALVANLACGKPHHGVAHQWFCEEGVVALLPLPGESVSLVWSAPTALAADLQALDAAAFASRVAERTQSAVGGLSLRGGVHAFPLRLIQVDRLVDRRLALVGDAAHVVHPLAGQGLNLGLQDVSEILRVLAEREPFRDVGDLVLLRRYARARAEAIGLMRGTTDGLAKLFGTDDPLVRRLRNAGMSIVDRLGPFKNALIRHAVR